MVCWWKTADAGERSDGRRDSTDLFMRFCRTAKGRSGWDYPATDWRNGWVTDSGSTSIQRAGWAAMLPTKWRLLEMEHTGRVRMQDCFWGGKHWTAGVGSAKPGWEICQSTVCGRM